MLHDFDRRALLKLGVAGAGLAALPASLRAQMLPSRGFTHDVASGDPGHDAVLLWTRFVGMGPAMLRVEVAEEPGFGRIVARGEGSADPASDWCCKIRVGGLVPGRWYFYRFTGPDGSVSPVGRTRTLPQGKLDRFNIAVFSCANKPFGYFNAYGHAAARADIDLIVHVGDYLYEYKRGEYPSLEESVSGRTIVPTTEIIALDDYRARYADYRTDPNLLALHRNFPMISIWDDHEFANDAWKDGAENHQPDEGPWEERKAHAKQAYHEWLPVAGRSYNSYQIGDLVSMLVLDTRVEGRDKQLDLAPALKGGKDGLIAFRDGAWSDPKRTLMGFEQEAWTARELKASTHGRTRWQLLAQQIVMGSILTPKSAATWLAPDAGKRAQGYVQAGIAAAAVGLPQNLDSWGGYFPARERLLSNAQEADANLVVVSGDSHNAWACDLKHGGKPAGVEFAGQSVTSPGFESVLKADVATIRAGLTGASPELKWCDTANRGYLTVSFTREVVRSDWVFMATVRQPSLATVKGQAAVAKRGRNVMELV